MFKKIAALSIFDGLTKIVSYILLPIYLALMPKEEFGEFSYIAVAVTYFSLFLSCNFYIPYIKYYCETNNDKIKQEWTSTIFTLILTILIVIDFIFIVNNQYLKSHLYIEELVSENKKKESKRKRKRVTGSAGGAGGWR